MFHKQMFTGHPKTMRHREDTNQIGFTRFLAVYHFIIVFYNCGLPRWLSGKCRFDLWVRKIPWRRKWQPTPVFLPGKSHGQKSLVGCNPWGRKELGTAGRLTPTNTKNYLGVCFKVLIFSHCYIWSASKDVSHVFSILKSFSLTSATCC